MDDGSTDRSLEMIKKMAEHSPEVKFISFSRNFGKEAAIYAGLEAATGDYAAVMDVDSGSSFPAPGYAGKPLRRKDMTVRDAPRHPAGGTAAAVLFRPRLL